MFAINKRPPSQFQVINSPLKEPGRKLTAADIARLKDKWAELVFVLRSWHGYGQTRADSAINAWLNAHR